jgi:hypothetical protein
MQFHGVVLSERSRDSSTGRGERASVGPPIAAGHLQDAVSLGNKTATKYWEVTNLSLDQQLSLLPFPLSGPNQQFSSFTENDLRTIYDLCELVVDTGHLFTDSCHPLIDGVCHL